MASEPEAQFRCPLCGERGFSRDAAWVEHLRSTHRCPSPERLKAADRITEALALAGLFDG
jgi:hypothetical protein